MKNSNFNAPANAQQRGFFMLTMAIALLAASIATIGIARSSLNNFKEDIGRNLGAQVQTIATALGAYMSFYESALLAGDDVPNVAIDHAPTVQELRTLKFLPSSIRLTPTDGGTYVTWIKVPSIDTTDTTDATNTPAPRPQGVVYLSNPIIGPDGRVADLRLMGAAMASSSGNQIGFSMPEDATHITGPNWRMSNPDPASRPGILLANVALTGVAATPSEQQVWLASVADFADLPKQNNKLGDIRLVRSSQKPMTWNGTAWVDLFIKGANNQVIGPNTGAALTTGENNSFVGKGAGQATTTGSGNIFLGTNAGLKNTTGLRNIFTGYRSGENFITGEDNIFTGYQSGKNIITGKGNIFTGYRSGEKHRGGIGNIFIGLSAGQEAGQTSSQSNNNIFIGENSGFMTTGNGNVFTGTYTGQSNTTGTGNIFSGYKAGTANTTGGNNVFIGFEAGVHNTTAGGNTFVGYRTGYNNTSGTNNTFIGRDSGVKDNTIFSNSTAIGYQARVTASNRVRIGNDSIDRISGKVGFSNDSDRRLKSQIQPSERGLDFIKQLQPVDYTLTANNMPDTGFIAQDVEAADPTFPGVGQPANHEDFYSIAYTSFIPAIVKSIQQLDSKMETLSIAHADPLQPQETGGRQLGFLEWCLAALLLTVFWLVFVLKRTINQHRVDIALLKERMPAF